MRSSSRSTRKTISAVSWSSDNRCRSTSSCGTPASDFSESCNDPNLSAAVCSVAAGPVRIVVVILFKMSMDYLVVFFFYLNVFLFSLKKNIGTESFNVSNKIGSALPEKKTTIKNIERNCFLTKIRCVKRKMEFYFENCFTNNIPRFHLISSFYTSNV